ncbi:MAG TPA: response regulator [Dehalococcoidales bacterium]|nr:response regulator [Dehalococcoidales bacterium]
MKKQATLLVVDDNKDLLKTFTLILKKKGYVVDTAENGIQALEKFTSRQFDLVLMDVKMPEMDGIEALHKIKEFNPSARVILMTAFCEESQFQKVMDEGACGTLHKPVNIAQLMEMIGEATKDPSILIVDDDDDFRFSMAQMLEIQNIRTETAINGEDAVRIARQRSINMAFVDIKMKAMDGLETSIKLKEISPDMIIVLMTGYREEANPIIEKARDFGVRTCLYKPFKITELCNLVFQAT